MLVQYTPVSSLTEEQKTRLGRFISNMRLENVGFVTFEGKTFSKADLLANFTQNGQKKSPPQALFG